MKFYNQTRLSDDVLIPVVKHAARAIRAKHGKVLIIVRRSRSYGRSSGYMEDADWVSRSFIAKRKYTKSSGYTDEREGHIKCKGLIVLRIPKARLGSWAGEGQQAKGTARNFFKLALHEWGHIYDMQKGRKFDQYNRNHRNRPHERRAEQYVKDIMDKPLPKEVERALGQLEHALYTEALEKEKHDVEKAER